MMEKEQRRQYWFVIKSLTDREIKRKYARSKLGITWSVLQPLLHMVVISLVFSKMFSRSIPKYPIYYLCGNVLWNLFTHSTNTAMTALVDNRLMLIKVKFPMQVFMLSRVYTAFVNFLYSLIGFVIMLCVFRVMPSVYMLYFPVVVMCMLLFSLGLSYILATAYVFFGDVKHLYTVLLTLWLYLSAIFYPVSGLPDMMQKVVGMNPVFIYINSLRDIVLYAQMPSNHDILYGFLWAFITFAIGNLVFNRNRNGIIQKL